MHSSWDSEPISRAMTSSSILLSELRTYTHNARWSPPVCPAYTRHLRTARGSLLQRPADPPHPHLTAQAGNSASCFATPVERIPRPFSMALPSGPHPVPTSKPWWLLTQIAGASDLASRSVSAVGRANHSSRPTLAIRHELRLPLSFASCQSQVLCYSVTGFFSFSAPRYVL